MKSPKLNSTKISLENILSRLDTTDHAPVKLIFVVLYILGAILIRGTQADIAAVTERIEFISPMAEFAAKNIFATYLIGGGIAVTILILLPLGKRTVQEQLRSVGLVNHSDEAPELKRRSKDKSIPESPSGNSPPRAFP